MHQSPDILASFGDWETRMERALASVRAGRGVLVVDDDPRGGTHEPCKGAAFFQACIQVSVVQAGDHVIRAVSDQPAGKPERCGGDELLLLSNRPQICDRGR